MEQLHWPDDVAGKISQDGQRAIRAVSVGGILPPCVGKGFVGLLTLWLLLIFGF